MNMMTRSKNSIENWELELNVKINIFRIVFILINHSSLYSSWLSKIHHFTIFEVFRLIGSDGLKVRHEYVFAFISYSFVYCIFQCQCVCVYICVFHITKLVKENNTMRLKRRNKWQGIKAVYSYQNGHIFKLIVKCIAVLSALDIRGLCFILIQRLLDLIYVYSILFSSLILFIYYILLLDVLLTYALCKGGFHCAHAN